MLNKKIIIVGKSASGKDYLIEYLEKKGLKRSISYTTRPIRKGEINGVTYNYVSDEYFKEMISKSELIEYHNFNNWYYGNTVEDFNNNDIFIKTVFGLDKLRMYRDECFIIYIDIESKIRKERLLARKDSNDSIDRRIEADELDFTDFTDFDYRITEPNYNLDNVCDIIFKNILE